MNGIIYIAYKQQKYINEAIFSAKSVKKHNPNLSITIFTDHDLKDNCFDIVKKLPIDQFKFRCKQDFLKNTPYEKTLYLDTDTYVDDNIEDLFNLLPRFDVCMVHDYARKREINENHPNLPNYYLFSSHIITNIIKNPIVNNHPKNSKDFKNGYYVGVPVTG